MANKRKEGTTPTSLWLDHETREILNALAIRTGMSRSAVVRESIRLMNSDASNVEVRRLVGELARTVGAA